MRTNIALKCLNGSVASHLTGSLLLSKILYKQVNKLFELHPNQVKEFFPSPLHLPNTLHSKIQQCLFYQLCFSPKRVWFTIQAVSIRPSTQPATAPRATRPSAAPCEAPHRRNPSRQEAHLRAPFEMRIDALRNEDISKGQWIEMDHFGFSKNTIINGTPSG
jgi:hypothetical protein